MIPILYAASETDFTTNGIGLLTDAVSCTVTEERNGAYEATLVYPAKGHLAEYIAEDAIIKAKPASAKGQYMKSVTITSTMGPGVKVSTVKYA